MIETRMAVHGGLLKRRHSALVGSGGVAGALLLAFILTLLPEDKAILVLAVFVGVLSGIYFGVALAPTGARNTAMNVAMSLVFAAFALLGAWTSPMFFALALFVHAAWDVVIDHPRALDEPIAPWYLPLCIGADVVLGVFVVIWFY